MRATELARLALLLNRGTRRRLIAANIGLTLGVTLVTLFVAGGTSLERTILEDVLGTLPITQLKVQPRPLDVGGLRLGRSAGMGGGRLDRETIETLRAVEGVEEIFPIAYAHFPVSLRGEVLGSTYGTDAPVQGVDPRWVAGEADPAYGFSATSDPVPVLVSRKVLQAYNAGFASANRLPQLTEGVIVGQPLEIVLGSSTLGGTAEGFERREAVIAGFSDRVDALALAVPIDLVLDYAKRFGDDGPPYDAAVVDVRDPGELAGVEAALEELGLELAPDAYLGRQVGLAVTIVTLMLTAVGAAVVILALLDIANTLQLALRERQYDLGVARALGVSERLLQSILVAESALSGVASALVALGASLLALNLGERFLTGSLAPILGGGPSLDVPPWLALGVLLATPIASALAALVPAHGAVRVSISRALRR